MIIESMIANLRFQTNSYWFGDTSTQEIVIIDVGGNPHDIKRKFEKSNFKPIAIILTHSHPDHSAGALDLSQICKIPLYCHSNAFRVSVSDYPNVKFVKEPDVIEVGSEKLQIINSPGHSPGGIMLVSFENKLIFTGDTLFRGNIGRTDLPGSNFNTLMESIKKIMHDPRITDDFAIFPGHGGKSDIDREKKTNIFRDNFL